MGDGSIIDSNSFSHKYANTISTKTVQVYKGTVAGAGNVTNVDLSFDNLVGTVDVSSLCNLLFFTVQGNKKVTKVIFPEPSANWSYLSLQECDITGVLDVSNLVKLGGSFSVCENPKMTNILSPPTSNNFYFWLARDCCLNGTLDLTGLKLGSTFGCSGNPQLTNIKFPSSSLTFSQITTYQTGISFLDISSLTNFGGGLMTQQCPNLTSIRNPVSSQKITYYDAYDCSLTGTLDVSGFSKLEGRIRVDGNDNLTNILLPSNAFYGQINQFNVKNCSLNTTKIDEIFLKLYNLYDASLPTYSPITYLNFSGSKNAWPTDGIDNRYISRIYNIFDMSTGVDVSISVNSEPMPASINVLKFDKNSYVSFSSPPLFYRPGDIAYLPIRLSLWLDVSNFGTDTNRPMIVYTSTNVPNTGGTFIVSTYANYLTFQVAGGDPSGSCRVDISTLSEQVLDIELYRNPSNNNQIGGLKINRESKPFLYNNASGGGGVWTETRAYFMIGALPDTDGSPSSFYRCSSVAIWNLTFPRMNKWKGWPDGSLNSAWEDRIGNINGTVYGTAPTTRTITL